MRTYGQYCSLARALDVVGERWTLLIVRELAIRDSRYSDLRDALPGVATNLLASRLRQLESEGVIERYQAPRPVGTAVYRLTDRGRGLLPAIRELTVWGEPTMAQGRGDDEFRGHWMALALEALWDRTTVTDAAPLTVVIRTGHEPVTVEVTTAGFSARPGDAPPGAAVVEVEGEPDAVMGMLTGRVRRGRRSGPRVSGPQDAVRRLDRLIRARARTLHESRGHRSG